MRHAGRTDLRANIVFMRTEPDSKRPATVATESTAPAPRPTGEATDAGHGRRAMRPWARTLTIGAAILMAAFVTVQVGGCGLKTPLQLPKKAPAPKPAS